MTRSDQTKRGLWQRLRSRLSGRKESSESELPNLTSQLDGQALTVPIYIDTNALLDLLASIEDGFSVVEKITTRTVATQATDHSATAGIGTEFGVANVLNLLKIDLGGSLNWKRSAGAGQERQSERYYTYGSLLHRLRTNLFDQGLVKRFDGSHESWDAIQPSDFVELRGVFRPNPLADSLAIIDRLMGLLQLFAGMQTFPNLPTKADRRKSQAEAKQLEQIRRFFAGIRSDLEKEEIRIFVIDLSESPRHKAVVSLFTEYLRDRSMTEITHREYRLLGKVVRNLADAEGESIDLLRGTALGGVGEEMLNELTSAFSQTEDHGMNLPKIETKIIAPALQVVPIAIYV